MLIYGKERMTDADFLTQDITLSISSKRLSDLKDFMSSVHDRVQPLISIFDDGDGSHDHFCFTLQDWVEGDTDIELNIVPFFAHIESASLQGQDFSLLRCGISSETSFMDFKIDCDFTEEREQIETMEASCDRGYCIAQWLERKRKARDAWRPATSAISDLVWEKHEDSSAYNILAVKCGSWKSPSLGSAGIDALCVCLNDYLEPVPSNKLSYLLDSAISAICSAFDVIERKTNVMLLIARQDLSEAARSLLSSYQHDQYINESRTHESCDSTILGAGISHSDGTLKDADFFTMTMTPDALKGLIEELAAILSRDDGRNDEHVHSFELEGCTFHFIVDDSMTMKPNRGVRR